MIKILVLAPALLLPLAVAKDEWELPLGEPQLKPGPSVELVSANCQVCHSADYISTQPLLTRAVWTATVLKMREKYGAPIPTNQVEQVVEYLTRAYGKK